MTAPHLSPIALVAGCTLVPQRDAPSSTARFDCFVRIVGTVSLSLQPSQRLIACLIAFDAVATLPELQTILRNMSGARRVAESVFISWTADGKQYRKVLSSRTTISLGKLPPNTDLDKELEAFLPVLAKHYPCSQSWLTKDVWTNVFRDAQAWLYNILPAYQFGAVYGHLRCTALPDSVLLRKAESHRVLMTADNHVDVGYAEEVALESTFEKEEEATARPRYLSELKAVFSAPTGSETVRVSDQKWRIRLKEGLQTISRKIGKSGSYVDSVLLWWICYLVTVGSLRLTNPAVTTIAKYFGDLAEQVAEAIAKAAARPTGVEPPFWDAVFQDLHTRVTDSSSRAALASFHVFCVESFCIEILPSVVYGKTVVESRVSANVVWPVELARALEMCSSVDSDPRVGAATKVLLSIARSVPIRIGEVSALHIEDISIEDGVMHIHYSPRANEHSGKSRSAPRYMRTSDPDAICVVQAWIDHRKSEREAADDSEYLFGDPFNIEKLYKFGRCVCLLNRLLKAVTGDPTVRFHTLRHSWINSAILQANEIYTGTREISHLQEIATMAGHAAVETTLECYFHQMEWAVRFSIDRYVDALPVSSTEIAGWLEMTSAAARKGKQRSNEPPTYYRQLLRHHALAVFRPIAAIAKPDADGDTTTKSTANLLTISHAFGDLVAGRDETSICLRTGLEIAQLNLLKAVATDCLNILDGDNMETQIRRSVWGTGVASTPAPKTPLPSRILEFCHFKWDQHLSGLVDSLTEMTRPTQEVQNAIQVWLMTKVDNVLDMSDPVRTKPLLMLLKKCGLNAGNVVIRIRCDNPKDRHAVAVAKNDMSTVNVLSTCQFIFQGMPRVEFVKERTGRPSAYALLTGCKSGLNARVPPAALRMSGFHTLMFLTAVWSGYHATVALGDAK